MWWTNCGSAEHFVAVPPDRDPTPVRSFPTFTNDLQRLADWLTACRVTSVAMEATGVYWIPLFEILETRGFTVLLVNARHVKNVPGRKRDVSDCEWLRDLHIVGLLRGSFRPTDGIVTLRAYLRHRQTLIETAGSHVQRMQKALVQMNVQQQLAACATTIEAHLHTLSADATPATTPLPAARPRQKSQGHEPRFELRTPLHQLTGVDLSQVEGIGPYPRCDCCRKSARTWPDGPATSTSRRGSPSPQRTRFRAVDS